jgi:hypothetical protein
MSSLPVRPGRVPGGSGRLWWRRDQAGRGTASPVAGPATPEPAGAGHPGRHLHPPPELRRDRTVGPEPEHVAAPGRRARNIPLRERNRMLLAAGFAPVYPETTVDLRPSARCGPGCARCSRHEPFPAVVLDLPVEPGRRQRQRRPVQRGRCDHLLEPPLNVMRISTPPRRPGPPHREPRPVAGASARPVAPEIAVTADESLAALYEELCSYGPSTLDSEPTPGDLACRCGSATRARAPRSSRSWPRRHAVRRDGVRAHDRVVPAGRRGDGVVPCVPSGPAGSPNHVNAIGYRYSIAP